MGADSLPNGEYVANTINAVQLRGNDLTMGQSATWRNIGIPYYVTGDMTVAGGSNPTLTIEAGVETRWAADCSLTIGEVEPGSLVAVGAAGKPVKFTGMGNRAGFWRGFIFGRNASGCRLEGVIIENAETGAEIWEDLGPFIRNSTFRSCSEYAIERMYEGGTSFILGLGNQFEGNAQDQNENEVEE
ncbi:MAG TPA: hypothetical protein VHS59_05015 [Bacillota bacterium]|nr:hypothetical protein [Bacillota bacterium]